MRSSAPGSPIARSADCAAGELSSAQAPAEVAEILDRCAVARDLSGGWFDPWAVPGGFDPSGYVKGWAAQNALAAFRSSGICGVLVNAAGDIASSGGLGDGTPFRIGIADPLAPLRLAEIVELTGAIATSGTYERGEHLIDPRSGRPAARAASASVTGPDLGLADALATAAGGGRRTCPRAVPRTRRLRGARHQPRRQQAADRPVPARRPGASGEPLARPVWPWPARKSGPDERLRAGIRRVRGRRAPPLAPPG